MMHRSLNSFQASRRFLIQFYVALSVACTASVARPAERSDDAESPPHVVIVLVDDLGYGDLKCYNPESKIATPAIDQLARQGMRFTDAHAAGPLCHLSRYGLLTGRYPFRADCGAWRRRPVIEANQLTIATLLKSQGYRTAMVGKWHLGFDEQNGYNAPLPGGPVDCGFDSYFGIRASTDIPPYFYIRDDHAVQPPTDHISANHSAGWSPIQGAFWRAGRIAPDLKLEDVLPRFTDEAVQVIQQHDTNGDQPLMLYVAMPAPHTPWLPSERFQGKSQAGMYGDFVMMVDAMTDRILNALDQKGMSDETLLFFTSDNGPVWYDKDVQRFGHDSSGGLRGMKSDAWECGHRMPFIVRWPRRVAAGTTSDQLIGFTDMLATLADYFNEPLESSGPLDSVSFLPVLLGDDDHPTNTAPLRETLVLKSGGGAMTVRIGPWKWIDQLGSGGFSQPSRIPPRPDGPKYQLYNLANDLGETRNLVDEHPEIVKHSRELLHATLNP